MRKHGFRCIAISAVGLVLALASCKVTETEYVDRVMEVEKTYAASPTFATTANDDGSVTVTMTSATEGAAIYYTTDGEEPTIASEKYGTALTVSADTAFAAIAVKDGIEKSPVSYAKISISTKTETKIETKTEYVDKSFGSAISVSASETDGGVKITLTCTTDGAEIRYTTDGKAPTAQSEKYTDAIEVEESTVIKAVAVKDGTVDSAVSVTTVSIRKITNTVEKTYAVAPTFTTEANDDGSVTVTMTSVTSGAAIYYTTNGEEPTTESTAYGEDEPVTVNENTTFSAIAVKDGMENSPVSYANVSITTKTVKQIETHTEYVDKIVKVDKTYAEPVTFTATETDDGVKLTLMTATSEAAIYYTTNGDTPTASSTAYNEAISITESTVVRAIAIPSDGETENSPVSVAVVTIKKIASAGETMKITLTPSTTAATKDDVTVTVSVTTGGSVTKVAYKNALVYTAALLFADNSASVLTATDGGCSFSVSENGTYSVAALDSDGREEIAWLTVQNIDKTAPAAVTNLSASYTASESKITFTWTDPADSDLDHVALTYKVGSADEVTVTVSKGTQTYAPTESVAAETEVSVSVTAYDAVGNASEAAAYSMTTEATWSITGMTLSKYHVAYNTMPEISVTLTGSNFDKLPTDDEDLKLKVKVFDGSTVQSGCTATATVDTATNTATATFTAPQGTNYTTGKTYTVKYAVNGTTYSNITQSLRVSEATSLYYSDGVCIYKSGSTSTKISQIDISTVTDSTTVNAKFTGYNFDIPDKLEATFFDSTGAATAYSATIDMSQFANTSNKVTFYQEVPVPKEEGTYTLELVVDGTAITKYTGTLWVYGTPTITSFRIPPAGISIKDQTVTATIYGTNFKAPSFNSSGFAVTCTDKPSIVGDSTVTVKSDIKATVTLTIPSAVGSYGVTVSYGTSNATAIFTVKDYTGYAVGDFFLNDGTRLAVGTELNEDQKAKVVAVLVFFNDKGVPFGVGLVQPSSKLSWAPKGTTGCNTKFTDIICTPNEFGSVAGSATFTGDTDGSDNWDVICSVDPMGTADSATNYPAFNYALTYGTTKNLTGEYSEGWYVPSIAELCYMYRNKDTINTSLTAAGGTSLDGSYWSSSQRSNGDDSVWYLGFYQGDVYGYGKERSANVCVIRAF